jgi:hypothetical protein
MNNSSFYATISERNPTRNSFGTSVSGTQQKFPSHILHFNEGALYILLDPKLAQPVQHLPCIGEAQGSSFRQPNFSFSMQAVLILCITRQRNICII